MESRKAFLCSRNCHSPAVLRSTLTSVQGEQHKATDGQRGGLEPGGVIGQVYGAVDHRGEFGAGGGQVGESGPREVTVAGWWDAGSER